MKNKVIVFLSLFSFLILTSISFPAYAIDYYDEYADMYGYTDYVSYPTEGLPSFGSYCSDSGNYAFFIIYSTYDNTFYMIQTSSNNSVSYKCDFFTTSSDLTVSASGNYRYCNIYSYNPETDSDWVSYKSASLTKFTLSVCSYSIYTAPFRVVYGSGISGGSGDYQYFPGIQFQSVSGETQNHYFCLTDSEYTSQSDEVGSEYVHMANFFDPLTGQYLDNDPYLNLSNGGSSSSNTTIVNVDMTETNNILSSIKNKLDTVSDELISLFEYLKDPINVNIENINIKINTLIDTLVTQFTNLQSYLDIKFEGVYNVVMYGNVEGDDSDIVEYENKLDSLNSDFDGFNSSISSAGDYVISSGDGIAASIESFGEVFSGVQAVAGLGSILVFALAVIFVMKLIGR